MASLNWRFTVTSEKLQKVLAQHGLGSRRAMERWIQAGRVEVNGQQALLGLRVGKRDQITVDGRLLKHEKSAQVQLETRQILAYFKDVGEICTRHDPQGRRTVFTSLPACPEGRWVMVGRLDVQTSGLLLFTNDGELAHQLMHPATGLVRVYLVRVYGHISEKILHTLKTGVSIDGHMQRFLEISPLKALERVSASKNHWYRVSVNEGRNRMVRKLWESQGLTVSRLKRIQYGPISLPAHLKPQHVHVLSQASIRQHFQRYLNSPV